MGKTGAKQNNRSGNSTKGLLHKDLKLTIIFAPCSRSELLDIYNPIEFPVVDRNMRVIIKQLETSGAYVSEVQDKVIYINCGSIKCAAHEEGPIILFPESKMDKLKRAIQLIHELLDYWHGYEGTVFTTFCCCQPLEDLSTALQSLLGCPSGIPSTSSSDFTSTASSSFSKEFDQYKQWTFINKHSSLYLAEYKYEAYNGKSEVENLKEENERMIESLPEEARKRFREYQDMKGVKMYGTSARLSLEQYVKYHPKYSNYLSSLDRNNKRLKEIDDENEAWGEKTHGQRLGYVHKQINDQYDPKINSIEGKYQPYLDEIAEKKRQLQAQQGIDGYSTPDSINSREYKAYDVGVEMHGETHKDDTIEYNGEYYTYEELSEMYTGMLNTMRFQKQSLIAQKDKAWKQAKEDIRKQVFMETQNAVLSIFAIVSIVLTPLVLVDIIVIVGKLATSEEKFSWRTALALGLDIFALVPFVGAVLKAGGIMGKVSHVAVADNIANDLTRQGIKVVSKETNLLTGSTPNIGGGAGEVIQTLPVISLKGYLSDISLYIKHFSNMSKEARATAAGNIGVQTIGHIGNIKGSYDAISNLTSDPAYTAKSNGDDFVIIVKN